MDASVGAVFTGCIAFFGGVCYSDSILDQVVTGWDALRICGESWR